MALLLFQGNLYDCQNSQCIDKTKTIEKHKLCKNQGNKKPEKQVGMQLSSEIRLGHRGKIQEIAQEYRDALRETRHKRKKNVIIKRQQKNFLNILSQLIFSPTIK